MRLHLCKSLVRQECLTNTATAARHQGGIVMDKILGRLTVFFEELLWIDKLERILG